MSSRSTYRYEITITTGIWIHAGTTARVAMEIHGSEESTGKLCLNSTNELVTTLFSRGSTDVFLLTWEKPLGNICGVRIGHDNSGKSPSWFLEDVVILDEQTLNSWTFSSNKWLALERGDGRTERLLETSTDKENFNKEVLNRWLKGLTEHHIWVSVFVKPARERFSRVQRASCCLCVLLSAMLANAMFYKLRPKSAQVIQVGPLKFSWRQVIIGVQSALIFAPVNILIVFLFKKGSSTQPGRPTDTVRKWPVYLAWFLCLLTCMISATFTAFYSIVWEKSKAEQWLSSMFISFIHDVSFTEPVRVFLTSMLLVVVARRKRKMDVRLAGLEETFQKLPKGSLWTMETSEEEGMRKRLTKKLNVSRFYLELLVYCVYVTILIVVCFGNRNDHRYWMTKSVHDGLSRFNEVSLGQTRSATFHNMHDNRFD